MDLVDDYVAIVEAQGVPIVAVLETHVQADHVSGLPALVERTGATPYLPAAAGVGNRRQPPPTSCAPAPRVSVTRGAGVSAARSGLHPTYVGGIERGERNPSLINIWRLAGALGVRVEELFLFPR
jgi:glyoxylase-like metal-dependent hydrolase (beta-lactamase superfamily II)